MPPPPGQTSSDEKPLRFSESFTPRSDTPLRRLFPQTVKQWKRGDVLIRDGGQFERIHLIRSGWMSRSRIVNNGNETFNATYVVGDFINLDAITESAASDTIRALCNTTTSSISVADLRRSFRESPDIALEVCRWLIADQDWLRQGLGAVGQLPAGDRIVIYLYAQYLRLLAAGDTAAVTGQFSFPLTQTDIGSIIGVTSVHVSRSLQDLRDQGIMDYHKGVLRVVDCTRLKEAVANIQ